MKIVLSLLFVCSLLMLDLFCSSTSSSEKSLPLPNPPECPGCCETLKPYPDISADDLMKIKYYVKYTKFAQDYTGIGTFKIINKKVYTRTREWRRYRILLGKRSDIFDYKDMLVILDPENIKGVSVLSWTYLDPNKDQEIWLWLPSLRKIRRISQSESDDSFMGSEWTTEEVSTRKWEDESYTMLGDKKFDGYTSVFNNKTYYKNTECYVIEAKPKRKEWYYSKRISRLDKHFGGLIYDEVYDSAGRKCRVFLKEYKVWDNGCIPQTFLELVNLINGNITVVSLKEEDIKFNTGLKESFFIEKTLMQSKW
jgi:Outer membrane lipoprotein-sorting protein